MLSSSTVSFLKNLEKNNDRNWFEEHKPAYLKAKENFEDFITAVITEFAQKDPLFLHHKAKDTIFRIYRDVRFSKNKNPYKTHLSSYIAKGGRKSPDAGYYIHIQPGNKSFMAAGLWMPESPQLKAVRQEIDYNYQSLLQILHKPAFKKVFPEVEGETLKKPPQGYTADNPALPLLMKKSFIVSSPISDKELTADSLVQSIVQKFLLAKPFVDFLNTASEDE
jgi:uncharacterized protein (TIGR02453 family)